MRASRNRNSYLALAKNQIPHYNPVNQRYPIMNRILLVLLLLATSLSLNAQDTLWMEVYYASDADILSSEYQKGLIKQLPSADTITLLSFRIESTCDDVGTEAYNQNLSLRRSRNLAKLIKTKHSYPIAPEIIGNGEKQLNTRNTDSFGILLERQVNRSSRVILIYEVEPGENAGMEINESPSFENLQIGQKMVLANILFVGGHDEFLPESYPSLDTLLAKLKTKPTIKIKIIGHVCCTPDGSEGMDLETGIFNLSKMRAQAVYLFLVNQGIEKTRMTFEGRGGSEPLGSGPKYDRRVELEIIAK